MEFVTATIMQHLTLFAVICGLQSLWLVVSAFVLPENAPVTPHRDVLPPLPRRVLLALTHVCELAYAVDGESDRDWAEQLPARLQSQLLQLYSIDPESVRVYRSSGVEAFSVVTTCGVGFVGIRGTAGPFDWLTNLRTVCLAQQANLRSRQAAP